MKGVNNASQYEVEVFYHSSAELAAVQLFRKYPEHLLQFGSVCCIIFMLIGIPGNFTTIVALARCKKVRNATAIFIINLHISKLIFCITVLPMIVMTFVQKHWTQGWIICRIFPFFRFSLNCISILTIIAISINRYVIVCHPTFYPWLYKRRNMSIMLLTVWILSLAMFVPSTIGAWGRFDLEPRGGYCTMLKDKNDRSPKTFLLIMAFIVPCLAIAFCYARIWWVVRKTVKKSLDRYAKTTRPTALPISQIQSDTSDGNTLISSNPTTPGYSTIEDDNTPTNNIASTVTTPNEERIIEKYFKAPFRLTRREVRPKTPTRKDKKLCAMIAATMISFCISHLPPMVTRLLYEYKEYKWEPHANMFADLLEFSGACINPIIYVIMSHEYRQAYKSLFGTIKQRFQRA